jgi:hypothetical protein
VLLGDYEHHAAIKRVMFAPGRTSAEPTPSVWLFGTNPVAGPAVPDRPHRTNVVNGTPELKLP